MIKNESRFENVLKKITQENMILRMNIVIGYDFNNYFYFLLFFKVIFI